MLPNGEYVFKRKKFGKSVLARSAAVLNQSVPGESLRRWTLESKSLTECTGVATTRRLRRDSQTLVGSRTDHEPASRGYPTASAEASRVWRICTALRIVVAETDPTPSFRY